MASTSKPASRFSTAALFIIIYATMFMFGLVENIKGVSFPLIKTEFGVTYDQQGGLVSLTWFGYVIFCLVASFFLMRFGIKRSVLAGYVLVSLGAVATLIAPSFWWVTLTLLIINAGFGFFEVGSNGLAAVVFTGQTAFMMNLMHFFYGFGAIVGPKTAGVLTGSLGMNWRQVYMAIIIPTVLVFLFILFTRFTGRAAQTGSGEQPRLIFMQALRSPLVWLFIVSLGFMEVIEFGASNWSALYLQDVYGLDPRVVGANFLSVYFILFTLARLFGGLAIERMGYIRSIVIALVGVLLTFLIGFGLGINGIWVLPVTGLFIGILFPTMMAVAIKVFDSDAPAITSVIITLAGAVNGVFQFIVGLTNQYIGVSWGYRSCVLYTVVILVVLYLLSARIKEARAKSELTKEKRTLDMI